MHCQADNLHTYAYAPSRSVTLGPALSKRRSTLPLLEAFGTVLRRLRDARGLSTGQVEIELGKLGAQLGRSTVTQYEKGRVWSPDVVVLTELCEIYRADVRGLVAALKANRQDPTLTVEQADAIRKGASDAGTVEVGLLRDERDASAEALREMRELAARIVAIATGRAADSEGEETVGHETGRGETHRAAHR